MHFLNHSRRFGRRALLGSAGMALAATSALGAAGDRNTQAEALIAQVLAELFERNPVFATQAGEHRYDDRWPDLSPAGLEKLRRWRIETIARLAAFGREGVSAEWQVDLDVLVAQLEADRFDDETLRPSTRNPLVYSQLIGSGLDDLTNRDFEPLPRRAESLARRLEALPGLIDQVVANLRREPVLAPQTRVAIQQLAGLQVLLRTEIPARLASAPQPLRNRVAAATPAALAAVEQLRSILEKELLPRASEDWRLGRANFERRLPLVLQTDLSAAQIYRLALAEHEKVRNRMAVLARELYAPLFGVAAFQKAVAEPDADQRLVQQVLDALAADHVAAAELRAACAENLERLKAFVEERKLVPQDPDALLRVIWTPPQQRGVAIAGLDPPAPLDADKPGLPSFYLVQPVPEEWPAARRESFLREYNNFLLEILSIHEAIPGHFVQLYYAKRTPSLVRRIFFNSPFGEGWAVYAEHFVIEAGYSGPEPPATRPVNLSEPLWRIRSDRELRAKAIALHGQKFYLRTVTNAVLDYAIHAEGMSEAQALALMVERSYQQEGEARAKWVRAQISSTQLSTYFVGAQGWFRLRAQAEARAKKRGEKFDQATFHAAALSHGSPPLPRLGELMGWS